MAKGPPVAIRRKIRGRRNERGEGFEMNIVLDSSVIAKLFIDEKDSDEAAEL